MPRPIIGLDDHKDAIKQWIFDDGLKLAQVIAKLRADHNVKLEKRTLERNLKAWGVSIRTRVTNVDELRADLTALFHDNLLSDGAICKQLNEAGHVVNVRTVMEMRRKLGLNKRKRNDTTEQDLQDTIKHLLEQEYQDEEVKKMHRDELYAYLRKKYPQHHIVGRDRVYHIAREMNTNLRRRYQRGDPRFKSHNKVNGKAKKKPPPDPLPDQDSQLHASAPVDTQVSAPVDPQPHAPAPADPSIPPIDDYDAAPTHHHSTIRQVLPATTALTSVPPAAQALDLSSRLDALERENVALQQRLQQRDAENESLRHAYHHLMATINTAPAFNAFAR